MRRLNVSITVASVASLATGLIGAFSAQAQDTHLQWSGQISASTEGVSKDVAETAGRGQIAGTVGLNYGSLFATAQWRNLREPGGIDGQQEYVLGTKGHAGDFDFDLSGGYKIKDNAPAGFQSHFVEWQGDISRTFASGTTVRITDLYSADAPGSTKSDNFIEMGLSQPLNARWRISGAIATRTLTPKNNYSAMNLGVSYALTPKTALDIRYYDTDKHENGDAFKGRIVLQLTQGF